MDAPPTRNTGQSHGIIPEDSETHTDSRAKRRKTRKGTRSCWECKRRKVRCVFGSPTDAICIICQRRGTKCVSQEFPEVVSAPLDRVRQVGDRVVRVEALVEHLIKKVGEEGRNSNLVTPTPSSLDSEYSPSLALDENSKDDQSIENQILDSDLGQDDLGQVELDTITSARPGLNRYGRLSNRLYESLPSPEDTERICNVRGYLSIFLHEMITTPYNALDENMLKSPVSLVKAPSSDAHPVLIARYMLHLASFLQNLHPDLHNEIQGLSEPPRTMMKRLVDTAINLVTTNDELLGSIEGLQCIIMESVYQANAGNLRRGLIVVRRAIVIAQLMGLDRSSGEAQYEMLDPKTKIYPQFIWFRILACDRHLCLMLGLPQGSHDHSMASDAMLAQDTPMGRLERIHCVIASRILERNEPGLSSTDYSLTQSLDMELQKAGRGMPSKWWLMPNLASVMNDPQALFWDTRRLINQLLHYNLLNQLHLPHMLCSCIGPKYEYSKIVCMNASREMLSRFIMFRSINQVAYCSRAIDFFALMAAVTLLLAHLDTHRSTQTENLLAHQKFGDRGMIEQAQESMEELNRLNGDALSAQSADLLRRLLAIEAEAADGHIHSIQSVSIQTPEAEMTQPDEDNHNIMRVHIPYFGIIKINRKGVISKEMHKPQDLTARNSQNQFPADERANTTMSEASHTDAAILSADASGPSETWNAVITISAESDPELPTALPPAYGTHAETQTHLGESSSLSNGGNGMAPQFLPQLPSAISENLLEQYHYPGIAAGADDWAFQGVDMAFFDNLMKGIDDGGNDGVGWTS